ncbi:TetR/AcrR family transcriptional regulator [Pseudomonas syringae]|uniref:TetR/AcrR family transcriptional regulator n=1 Tax=Pseudomonas syringae TaxID=317 RepID=UPI0006ACF895|nr:TetR/AcrR family transcriptional regulator [Pseudomonas syringae]
MTNTVEKTNTRDRLLAVAAELFSVHGYQAVGVRDIAKLLGINAGSIYNHVDSKQTLLYELVDETLCNLISRTQRSINSKSSALSRLHKFIEIFFDFNKAFPGQMLVVSREEYNLNTEQKAGVSARYADYMMLLENILRGIIPQYSNQGVSRLARTILAFMFGQLFLKELALSNSSLSQFITRLVWIEGSRHHATPVAPPQ